MTYDEAQTPHVSPRTELERRIAQIWEQALGIDSISIRDNFFDTGGSSIQAYQILADIARELGAQLSAETLLEASTIEEQAALIEAGDLEPEGCLVPFRAEGSRSPWFCVHGQGGGVLFLSHLLPHLDPGRPVYGIQPVAHGDGLPAFRTVEQMAADYVAEVRSFQPKGPYYLGGSCFGGLVAREMARILHHEQDEEVALVVCIDPPRPSLPDPSFSGRAKRSVTFRIQKRLRRRIRRQFPDYQKRQMRSLGEDRFEHYKKIHGRAKVGYVPSPSDVPMVIVGSQGTTRSHRMMWGPVSPSGVEVLEIPAVHLALFLPPNAPKLAALVQQALDEADRRRLDG